MKEFPKFNSQQVDFIVEKLREMLGPDIADMLDDFGINPNHLVRFQYIANLCRNTREEKGLSVKQASSKSKIPQYRLKAIEGGSLRDIVPDHLEKYVEFLELRDAFNDWLKENQDVYDGIVNKNAK